MLQEVDKPTRRRLGCVAPLPQLANDLQRLIPSAPDLDAISSGGSGASSENSRSWAGITPVDDQETRSREDP